MLRKILHQIRFEKEWFVVTIFIWSYLMYAWYGLYTFDLKIPPGVSMSQATLDGVDVGQRIVFFYKAIVGGMILFPILYSLICWLARLCIIREYEKQVPFILSGTGFVLVVADLYGFESSCSIDFIFCLLALYIFFGLFASRFSSYRQIVHPLYFSTVIVVSFLFTTMLMFVLNSSDFITGHVNLVFVVCALLVCIKFAFWKKKFRVLSSKLFILALPMAFMPILLFGSVEALFYFKLNHHLFIHYIRWFLAAMALLFLVFFLVRTKFKKHIHTSRLLSLWFAPAALLSFILLTFYTPIQSQPNDFFELANAANAQMRIWKFNEMPCFDFMSSHMMSEQWFGLMYHSVFGYDGRLDFLTYGFLSNVIFYFLVYYFGIKIFRQPTLVLLLLIAFPFVQTLFSEPIFISVLILYAVDRLVKKQTVRNYLVIFILILLLMLWRLDAGSAGLWAAVIFIPVVHFSERRLLDIVKLMKGLLLFLAVISIFILLAFWFRSPDHIISNFRNAFHYLSANQAHGYSLLSREMNQQFYFFYVMIPFISLVSIIVIAYLKRSKGIDMGTQNTFLLNASMFFYVVVLVNFQRGLVRHGFIEYNDCYLSSTFYLATSLLVIYFIPFHRVSFRYLAFFAVSFFLMVTLTYFPMAKEKTSFEHFITEHNLTNLNRQIHDKHLVGRIEYEEGFDTKTFADFKKCLDSMLAPAQTFLDFSNSPMMYYFCQRKIPSYFCQSLQNTVDDFTQKEQLKLLNISEVPVLIFSNYPLNWFDATDEIPNVMRYPYLAEFIFRNYKPYAVINQKSIWINKELNWKNTGLEIDTLLLKPQYVHYKKAAYLLNRFYSEHPAKLQMQYETVPLTDSEGGISIQWPDKLHSLQSVVIRIHIQNPSGNGITGVLNSNGISSSGFTFETKAGEQDYIIRLSNQYAWYDRSVNHILFSDLKGQNLEKVQFYTEIN